MWRRVATGSEVRMERFYHEDHEGHEVGMPGDGAGGGGWGGEGGGGQLRVPGAGPAVDSVAADHGTVSCFSRRNVPLASETNQPDDSNKHGVAWQQASGWTQVMLGRWYKHCCKVSWHERKPCCGSTTESTLSDPPMELAP